MTLNLIFIIMAICAFPSDCTCFSLESRLKRLEAAIQEKDKRIVLLENSLEKLLEEILLQRDGRITLLEKAMLQKDGDILRLNNQMTLMRESWNAMESRNKCSSDKGQRQSKLNEKTVSHIISDFNKTINTRKETKETDLKANVDNDVPVLNRKLNKFKRESVTTNIAFHAYLRSDSTFHTHETIIFDTEEIDVGDGYNSGDGIYDVPVTGVYVFTWTIGSIGHTFHIGELMINGVMKGLVIGDSGNSSDKHQGTGVVVVHVNKGDHVSVRLGANNGGDVVSDNVYTRMTFSGWQLFSM